MESTDPNYTKWKKGKGERQKIIKKRRDWEYKLSRCRTNEQLPLTSDGTENLFFFNPYGTEILSKTDTACSVSTQSPKQTKGYVDNIVYSLCLKLIVPL